MVNRSSSFCVFEPMEQKEQKKREKLQLFAYTYIKHAPGSTNTLQKHLQKYLHHNFLPRASSLTPFLDLTSRRADILTLSSF